MVVVVVCLAFAQMVAVMVVIPGLLVLLTLAQMVVVGVLTSDRLMFLSSAQIVAPVFDFRLLLVRHVLVGPTLRWFVCCW